ncbi:hypothetical protein [Streptomyces lonarensis]|uniref:Uncharacterized protein n=1 Tax=Streptomyces lonarensis TaxID=700599 RepID=A0A7X6D1Y9_9ACTN|nr:hypothetical protein [Streptomyces lonarensis]NJQ06682.1 hypothetical protein [Streptomyces lonarensis]
MKQTRTTVGSLFLLAAVAAAAPAHAASEEAGPTQRPAAPAAPFPGGDVRGDVRGVGESCLVVVPNAERPLFRLSERADRRCPAPHVIAHS